MILISEAVSIHKPQSYLSVAPFMLPLSIAKMTIPGNKVWHLLKKMGEKIKKWTFTNEEKSDSVSADYRLVCKPCIFPSSISPSGSEQHDLMKDVPSCPWDVGWTRWSLKVLSNTNHSVSLCSSTSLLQLRFRTSSVGVHILHHFNCPV